MILAIDIALRKSGYVLLDDKNEIVDHGVVIVSPKLDYTQSVISVYEQFLELFLRIAKQYNTEDIKIVVEDVADFFHKVSALGIHAARTSVVLARKSAHYSNLNIRYYTPSKVKYFLTNKRGADKALILAKIQENYPNYPYTELGEDEVDALGLALLHISIGDHNESIPKTKQRGVSKRPRSSKGSNS